ncbi:MAG: hypothetical protein KBS85_08585, partial [Lachnospiraceae bacterium]|nr:hypothetical protein [Candidatus Merdinaster equi]
MSENIIATMNHQKYDRLFRLIFKEPKELLSLYNALSGKNYDDPNQLIINTLEDAVFIGIKNDVSFIINSYLNLYEHQTTINPNMPLRGLFYFADLLKTEYKNAPIYGSVKIPLLTPQYVIFYNGIVDVPERYEMRLSDLFIHKTTSPDLEVVAHVININLGHNKELADKCQMLREYMIFVDSVRGKLSDKPKELHRTLLAEVIDECIDKGILSEILHKERYRIMESFLSHFDADEYVDYVKKESYESGYDSG